MSAATILIVVAAQLGLSVLAPFLLRANASRLVYGTSLVLSALIFAGVLDFILDRAPAAELVLPVGLPWLGAHFALDPLSAFFLLLANLGGAAAGLYGMGYGAYEKEPHRVVPFFPLFLAAMNLVLLAADAFTFLLSWELMSLVSWALVISGHRQAENMRAGYVYLLMAGFGTMALLLAFGLLAGPAGGYSFAAMREAAASPVLTAAVFALVLLGAGSKAGLVPLHVWLPLAHPAAPSHVSALMSGVMTKVAVYGVIRILFDLLDDPQWWTSMAVLALGGLTALLGILHALMETDLKRLLAYSTIENVGVIFVSIGLALAFESQQMTGPAALALAAALFHAFNHSLFKSLLFLGAGAVLGATGERDMERLGGLIHKMPATSLLFLGGSIAISALPPFNGFVSEWLAFQAVLQSPDLPQWGLRVMVPAMGGVLAMSAALAAAAFVRAYGVTFLGRPRGGSVAQARETDVFSLAAMSALGVLCLLAGLLPGLVIDGLLAPATVHLVGARMPAQLSNAWLTLTPISDTRSSYNGLLFFLFITASALLAAFLAHRLSSRATRFGPAWDCGFPDPDPATQYSATSFSQPLRRVFGPYAFRAREEVDLPRPGEMRPARMRVKMHDLAWEGIYLPVAGAVDWIAGKLNRFQFLTIRRYLALVFVSLVSLLMVLALWG